MVRDENVDFKPMKKYICSALFEINRRDVPQETQVQDAEIAIAYWLTGSSLPLNLYFSSNRNTLPSVEVPNDTFSIETRESSMLLVVMVVPNPYANANSYRDNDSNSNGNQPLLRMM